MFEEYAHAINQRFPQMHISGGNFPPGQMRQSLASFIGFAKLALLALIIMGDKLNIFENLQIAPPPIYIWASQNKVSFSLLFQNLSLIDFDATIEQALEQILPVLYGDYPL